MNKVPKVDVNVDSNCCNKSFFACLCFSSCCKKALDPIEQALKKYDINDKGIVKKMKSVLDLLEKVREKVPENVIIEMVKKDGP